jgi:Cys-tRNA(Pro)/Cys-tRNA(Cys) deacylase
VVKKAEAGTPAMLALTRAGVAYTVHPYQHDARAMSYGLEAAAALGVPPERVFKTLVAEVDGQLVVAVVPVDKQLDLKALAAALQGKKAAIAAPDRAERSTGYVVGGISPVGQKRQLRTVVDSTLLDHETVYVSAGRRGADLELPPADLVRVTTAVVAPVAR